MLQGGTLGAWGGVGVPRGQFFSNMIMWHIKLSGMMSRTGQIKRSNIIKFQLQSQFQRLLYQTLCVFSQIKDIIYIERIFHSVAWVMPQGMTCVC